MRATAVDDSDPMYLFEPVVLPGTRGKDYQQVLDLFDDPGRLRSSTISYFYDFSGYNDRLWFALPVSCSW